MMVYFSSGCHWLAYSVIVVLPVDILGYSKNNIRFGNIQSTLISRLH